MKKVTFTSWVLSITAYTTIIVLSCIIFKEYSSKYKIIGISKLGYLSWIEIILYVVLIALTTYNFISYSCKYFKQVSTRRKNKRKREEG